MNTKKQLKVSVFKKELKFPLWQMVVFALIFGALGSYVIYRSSAASPVVATVQAEQLVLPAGSSVITDAQASNGQAVKMTANGTASGTVSLPSNATSVTLTAKGQRCHGSWPKASLKIDGNTSLSSTSISSTSWRGYSANVALSAGTHTINIVYANARGTCRPLYLDAVTFYGPSIATPAPTVSLGASSTSVTSGSASTLIWSSTNASSCTASGAWSGAQPTSGSTSTGALNTSSTYNLSCTGTSGTASASISVSVSVASSNNVQLGAFIPYSGNRAADLNSFTQLVGGTPKMVMVYRDWGSQLIYSGEFDPYATKNITPVETWEPTNASLKAISAGNYDSYIKASAQQAAAFGKPIDIRFAHEMNGKWEPWGLGVNGNTASDYVNAWIHIVTIFRQAGVQNVKWVWCPNVIGTTSPDFTALYPGDNWVDIVGLDGYNASSTDGSPWLSFSQIFDASYVKITSLSTKPVQISETASVEAGGSKANWIQQAYLTDIPTKYPRIRSILWFDKDYSSVNGADWRIDTSSSSLAAYRQVVASPLYQ